MIRMTRKTSMTINDERDRYGENDKFDEHVVEKRTGEGPALELKLALLKLRLRLPSSAERGRSGDLRREREDILPPGV